MAEAHASNEELENYSLARLVLERTAALEEHFLICDPCRSALESLEPLNWIHYTPEGPFYWRITRLSTGKFFARHWGCAVEGGREFRTLSGARKYLARSFAELFPEHVCTIRCGSTRSLPRR